MLLQAITILYVVPYAVQEKARFTKGLDTSMGVMVTRGGWDLVCRTVLPVHVVPNGCTFMKVLITHQPIGRIYICRTARGDEPF